MRKAARIVLRLVVVTLALSLPILVAEGGYSLVKGRSLIRRVAGLVDDGGPMIRLSDADRAAAARTTKGPWALARNPAVGLRMKSEITYAFKGVDSTTDEQGMRVRMGPKPTTGGSRIVVLGDSVAYGYGVRDTDTYAHQMEGLLAGTMGDDSPWPTAFTVGCPGWTADNAFHYISDHLHRYRPDVVFFVLVNNDLQDGFNVTESGHQDIVFDPERGGTAPPISREAFDHLRRVLAPKAPLPVVAEVLAHGGASSVEHVLNTWVTPTSRRRWKKLTDGLRDLSDQLTHQGGRLVLVLRWDDYDFERLAEHVVASALPELPILFLFSERRWSEDTLPDDPHPTARCLRAGAWRMVEMLVSKGWVPGAGTRPLPPEDPEYANRRARRFSKAESADWLRTYHERVTRFIVPVIDLDASVGFHQIYSEVHPDDGTVGRHLLCAFPNRGAQRLELKLERLPAETLVYPLSLRASINQMDVGTVQVPEPDQGASLAFTAIFPLPTEMDAPFVDVTITASHVIAENHRGTTRLAAFRLKRIQLRQ